jgi:hypothetical protein
MNRRVVIFFTGTWYAEGVAFLVPIWAIAHRSEADFTQFTDIEAVPNNDAGKDSAATEWVKERYRIKHDLHNWWRSKG